MATAAQDLVMDAGYQNWLRVGLALLYMKEGLHSFIQNEVKAMHGSLVQDIHTGSTGSLIRCTSCTFQNIKWNKGRSRWEFRPHCPSSLCDAWMKRLLSFHKCHTSANIFWDNCDVTSWPFSPWECAKVFMPRGQSSNTGPVETDAQALLTIMSNCKYFHRQHSDIGKLSEKGQNQAHQVSLIRNKVMHAGDLRLLETEMRHSIKEIIQLLEDPVHLVSLEECRCAVMNILKIRDAGIYICFSQDMETRALGEILQNIRQELCLIRVETTGETPDSLKQKISALQQEINQQLKDVHRELESQTRRSLDMDEHLKTLDGSLLCVQQKAETQSATLDKLQKELVTKKKGKETHTKRSPESDGLRQLKNQTEDNLDTFRKMGFIPTSQTEEAKKLLQEKGSVVIKGNPGEGKTSTALHLIDNDNYTNQCVVVKSPRQWETVDTDWVKIVVLEDIFGQYDLNLDRLHQWTDGCLQTIQNHVDVGKLQIIITIRDDIMFKAYSNLSSFKLFASDMSLTLSSIKLKNSDKMSILNRVLLRNNKSMNVAEKEQCVANFSGLIGFPQCCSLFAFHKDLYDQGPRFFKSPEKFLVNNIEYLKATSFLSLAFLFCNLEIEEEYLSHSQIKKSKSYLPVLEKLAPYFNISVNESTMISLRESYDHLSGLYVNKVFSYKHHSGGNVRKSCIRFSHSTVYEAVGQILGNRYPEMVVKYGNSRYLYQRTYTAEARDVTSQNVYIPVSVYGTLARRMIHDVVEKQLVERVVNHAAIKQHQFLMTLKNELRKSNKIRDFFMAKKFYVHDSFGEDLSEGECITFLQYILQSDEDVVRLVYGQFLEFLTCAYNNKSLDCWQYNEKQKLLELALYYGHFEIADKLIAMNACYTHVSLCNAARHGDLSRVQTILQYLKRSLVFNPECTETKKALCRAYVSDNQDIIEILIQEGITLDEEHTVDVVQNGDINVLMKVVEHLKCHNRWDPHLEQSRACRYFFPPNMYSGKFRHYHNPLCQTVSVPCATALYITFCNEKFDMADYLLKNEAKVSMRMLTYVSEYSSQQAVASMIKHMKVTGTWDPHCDDAYKALQKAYRAQKYDVCDLLVQAGSSLTMKNLSDDIMGFQVSLESVKKAIQHLKDTDGWDPRCDDASKALEKAFGTHKYDVCDLLIQEGVSLTMKNLLVVVWRFQVSFESIKKAIQHLKDTESWDPKCNVGSKALEKAYGQHRNEVCDLLIQEGVSLTMKNVHGIVKDVLVSLESVKNAIQHLKDTESWDPTCYDASKALEQAFIHHKNDFCDLLIQEGVSLTMRNFHGIVKAVVISLESVKKAMQHLKDTESWNPKCYDASKALEKAYSQQKIDVYHLLIQEGVSLTMQYLLLVVRRSQVSLKSVTNTIQRLKETESWDPKCYNASEALIKAYCRHNYNVCDLLIQEGVSLTMKNLPGVVMGFQISLESVKKAIQHLKDTESWDPKCNYASEALEKAYSQREYDMCDLLVDEGVSLTVKLLPGIILRSLDYVKAAVKQLKDTDSWDPKCDVASGTLASACKTGRYEVFDLLIQEKISLTMKNLTSVISEFGEPLKSVMKAIQHLKDTDNWDPKCDDASKALGKAYGIQEYDVCDLLIQEGVSLTMKNLRVVVRTFQDSLEPVKKTIQHLKTTDSWDPKCYDASQALEKAYSQEKYDVCDLLVHEGVSLTMKNLPVLVWTFQKSLESVNKVIEHLKNTDRWDPKCYDASQALEEAYSRHRYDVCDLLIQKGVSLTMKNLPCVVMEFQVALESVKKAIQHLKDTDRWDPKCVDASKALVKAYGTQKYDVCDLLIQEGVSLTMKNLPRVVIEFQVPLESVKKAIQHLKDTDCWDPKCDDASKALVKAYGTQKYDVCDLLIQDGVSLTMKDLPRVVIEFQVPLESVKKAVQHLKDTESWNSKCVDASKALAAAYSQHAYDVCDLLIQEAVSQTMNNLTSMISTFKSSLERN